ncbi:hypothetical protein AAC387_Pa04g1777 [Persea americana]
MSMHVPCVTTHATKLPICSPTSIAFKRYKRPWPKDVGFPFFSGNLSSLNKLGLSEIASPFSGSHQSPQMEAEMGISIPEGEKYSKELDVAVRVVQMACCICQRVQESLIQSSNGLIKSKEDDSPVTVADWSVQATVSWTLSKADEAGLLESVVNTVNECLSEAPVFGLAGPKKPLGTLGRHWVLDPVDGTLGFVRGDQYAIALAMIEDGEVVLGVLGCPNYPMKKEWLNYRHRYYRLMSKLSPPTAESWDKERPDFIQACLQLWICFRSPFKGFIKDVEGRIPYYQQDWIDGLRSGMRLLAPTVYILFASALPVIAFGEQISNETVQDGSCNGLQHYATLGRDKLQGNGLRTVTL